MNLTEQIKTQGNCFKGGDKLPPSFKKRIRPMSKKRQNDNKEYLKRRKVYLDAHPLCEAFWLIWPNEPKRPAATEIHHKLGRGKYLLDESTWCAISRQAHWFIHRNHGKARKLGLLK